MDDTPSILDVGSIVLFAEDVEATARFYRALGLPLASEQHGDGPVHYKCTLGPTHFAIFVGTPGAPKVPAPDHRLAGGQFFGLTVASLDAAFAGAKSHGASVVQEPRDYPWGKRALVRDPDERVVELFERP